MPNALGVAEVDGFANVKAEAGRRHYARCELSGVQRDMHLRIDRVKVVEHLHLQVIVAHGEVAILGHHEVDANDVRIGGGDLEAKQRLRKDLLRWVAAKDLVEEVNLNVARRRSIARTIAMFDAVAYFECTRELGAINRDFVTQSSSDQLVA